MILARGPGFDSRTGPVVGSFGQNHLEVVKLSLKNVWKLYYHTLCNSYVFISLFFKSPKPSRFFSFQWKLSCILVMKIFPIEDSPYASERQEMAEHGRWNVFCKSKSISMHLTCFSVSSRISYCPLGVGGGERGREYLRIIWFLGRAEGFRKAVFRVVVSG